MQLQRELDLPLRYHGRRDHAGGSGPIGNEGIRLRKYGMVEGVEKLGAKLQVDSFRHIKEFACGQIRRRRSRPFQYVLARIAEAPVGAVGNWKVIHIEPQ